MAIPRRAWARVRCDRGSGGSAVLCIVGREVAREMEGGEQMERRAETRDERQETM